MTETARHGAGVDVVDAGVTCSLGRTWPDVLSAIKRGQSGLVYEEIHGYPTAIGRVKDDFRLEWDDGIVLDRGVALALDCVEQLRPLGRVNRSRCGVFWGVGIAGAHWLEDSYELYCADRGEARVSPWTVPMIMPNASAALIAKHLGFTGGAWTQASACASSALAIGQAYQAIRSGALDVAVVGGSDAMLTPGMLHAWARMRVLARASEADAPKVCKPFDAARNGLCLAEGAACLVLMNSELATASAVQPLAQLEGFGCSCDAFDLTVPHAQGQAQAIAAAVSDARIGAADLSYVCAHATGTRKGDATELHALRLALGDVVPKCPVSSIKSVVGHTMGASGALACVLTTAMLHDNWVAPTQHLYTPDMAFTGWNLVAQTGRKDSDLNYALINAFGFGGSNACLVLKK
ncbi:beta-ketoacyl synthase [Limnohabitans sp.]|uniref:beta-ketoacyl-[acyl-carrier-protein] synthase family protein n=1 Tax=Limnohabitans sp. TaxID=1907725 RepID=UPI0035B2B9DD